ncbi:MAG: ester cyclase [Chloroflexi bacterium]|nr:ester cyclase [Chloroflexota bacterium]MCI0769476.1 ester cyclase [Chloroflexota bacterium]
MSEQNKALTRRFYDEVINNKNLAAIDELCAADCANHSAPPGLPGGTEGLKQMFGTFFSAFPDLSVTIDHMIAEGDLVAVHTTTQGTHKGELMGIAATGNQFSNKGIDLIRIAGGKATDIWHYEEELSFYQQLGVTTIPGAEE